MLVYQRVVCKLRYRGMVMVKLHIMATTEVAVDKWKSSGRFRKTKSFKGCSRVYCWCIHMKVLYKHTSTYCLYHFVPPIQIQRHCSLGSTGFNWSLFCQILKRFQQSSNAARSFVVSASMVGLPSRFAPNEWAILMVTLAINRSILRYFIFCTNP